VSAAIRYIDVLAAHAEQTPRATALRDPSGSLSYAQLWQGVASVAVWLRGRGVGPGHRVAVALPPSAANFVIMFGAMAAGAVAAPVNINLRRDELNQYLRRIAPSVTIAGTDQVDLIDPGVAGSVAGAPAPVTGGGPLSLLDAIGIAGGADAGELDLSSIDPAAPAIMFGTGGTTGLPKAAAWSHQALWLYAASCCAAMEVRRTDTELFFSPLFHIAVVTGPFGTLFSGGTVQVLPEFNAANVTTVLAGGGITRMFGAPTALMRVIDSDGFDPALMGRVRRVLFGSTRSEPDLAARLAAAFPSAEFVTGYGATEFGAVLRLRSWEAVPGGDSGVGRPVPGVSILIVGPAGEILPPGEVGELVVRAPWQMLGYWGTDAETERAFIHGGVRSGDLGERDAEGNIHLRGRSKDVVITGGENVFPIEVEDALSGHPDIAEAAVVGVLDREWGERVEAAVVLVATSAPPSAQDLTAYCRERLARYKVPKRFHILDGLPLTSAMKVDKRALREMLGDV
jgi:acyl-CoA synthetase (AMP-forming)/AMP-acid ligase II